MKENKTFKERVSDILETTKPKKDIGGFFYWFLIALIILNIGAVIAGSHNDFATKFKQPLNVFEIFSISIFTIEYILRLWTATIKYKDSKRPYLAFIKSGMGIIDLLSILPFFRFLRLFRLLRIFKLYRYNNSMSTIGKVLNKEKDKLLSTFVIIVILLFFASSAMYYIENAAQPDKFPNIIATFWWAVATLTTVGYGDVYPITDQGKILSGIIAILGLGMVALPSGIISGGFREIIEEELTDKKVRDAFDKEGTLSKIKKTIIAEKLKPSLEDLARKHSLVLIGCEYLEGVKYWFGFENTKRENVFIGFEFEKRDFKDLSYYIDDEEDAKKRIPQELKDKLGKSLYGLMDKKYRDWDKEVFVSLLRNKDNDVIAAIENKTIELLNIIEQYDL
jgi:voltage-gated potassium channel